VASNNVIFSGSGLYFPAGRSATHLPGALGLIPAQWKPSGQSLVFEHSPCFGQFVTQMPSALGLMPAQCLSFGQGLLLEQSSKRSATQMPGAFGRATPAQWWPEGQSLEFSQEITGAEAEPVGSAEVARTVIEANAIETIRSG